LHLVATYGYLMVFLIVMAESAGIPLPGETSLLVAGAFAATGGLWLPGVIAAAALGAILGDTGGYWVGRTSGLRLLRKHGRLLRFDEQKLARAEEFFSRHGEKTVFLGRFVPVGRIFSAVLAGIGHMRYRRFLLWNAAGGVVWATLMGTLGYLFGRQLPLIERLVSQFGIGLLLALVALVALRFAWSRRAALSARVSAWRARLAEASVASHSTHGEALDTFDAARSHLRGQYRRYLAIGSAGAAALAGVCAAYLLLT
jgi:membrane protein DedA with SNARE-associated domain